MDDKNPKQTQSSEAAEFEVPVISAAPNFPVQAIQNSDNTSGPSPRLKTIFKIVLGVVGLLVLLLALFISGIYRGDAQGEKKYQQAKQRCGHEPLYYGSGRPSFEAPSAEFGLGPEIRPDASDKFYCTLSEASADGIDPYWINKLREEIKNDTTIPPSLKQQYE